MRPWCLYFMLIAMLLAFVLASFVLQLRTEVGALKFELEECHRLRRSCALELQAKAAAQDATQLVYRLAVQKSKRYVPLRFVREMVETAMRYDDGVLLVALITVESHFDPFDVSPSGAVGCGQVKPSVWDKFLKEKGIVQSDRDYRDPVKCVDIAAAVLNHLLEKAEGDITKALAYYQCGEADKKCQRTTGVKYARDVMKEYGYYLYEVNRLNRQQINTKGG